MLNLVYSATVALALLVTPTAAGNHTPEERPDCKTIQQHQAQFGERLVVTLRSTLTGRVFAITASDKTLTWTVGRLYPPDRFCVVDFGDEWRPVLRGTKI